VEFFDVISERRSIRSFKDKPVEKEKLQRILETANLAPSAGNLQAYEIFVIESNEKKQQLAAAAKRQGPITEAPVVLIFAANPKRSSAKYGDRGSELYCIQDATIAAAHMQLAVTALGLGSVWMGAFDEDTVNKVMGAPAGLRPVAIIPIGYSAIEPLKTPRRKLEDLAHWEMRK
jgi:nitroreductase